jgi:hypothetical protein
MAVPGAESLGTTVLELKTDSTEYFDDIAKAEREALGMGETFRRVGGDLQQFAQGVKATGQQSVQAADLISKAFGAAEKQTNNLVGTMRQFTGVDVIGKANAYASAVTAIGGAAKLTAAEQRQVNAAVTEAIQKYEALGQEAPAALHALQAQTSQVVHTVEPLPAHLQQVGEKSTFAASATNQLKTSFANLTAAFTLSALIEKAVSSLIAFGAAAIENAGHLVDMANKANLSLKTIQQFQFVSSQSGTSVDTLTNSVFKLGTQLAEGNKSTRQAVADLGLEFDKLRASKPEDAFNATLAALEKMDPTFDRNLAMQRLFGKGAKDVAQLVADGYTKMKDAAQTSSDEQILALDAAGDAWEAFKQRVGASTTSLLGTLVLAGQQALEMPILKVMLAMSMDLPRAIAMLATLRAEHNKTVKDLNLPLEGDHAIDSYRKHLEDLKTDLIALSPAQKAAIKDARDLNQSATEIAAGLGISEDAVTNFIASLKELDKANNWITQLRASAKELETQLQLAEKAGVPMTLVLEEFGAAIKTVSDRAPLLGDSIGQATQRAAAALKAANLAKVVEKIGEQTNDEARKLIKQMEQTGAQAGNQFARALAASNKTIISDFDATQKALLNLQEDSLEKRLALINFEYDRQQAALDTTATLFQTHYDVLQQERMQALRQATADWQAHLSQVQNSVQSWSKRIGTLLKGVPALLQQALTGGGGLEGFGKALASKIGSDLIGGKVEDALYGLLNKSSRSLGNLFGQKFVGMLGDLVPGIGPIIGAALGPLIGKVGGFFKKIFGGGSAGRDLVEDFVNKQFGGSFDKLHTQLLSLGADGERMWVQLTQGVGRNNPQQAQAAIDAITQALAKAAQNDATFNSKLQTTLERLRDIGGAVSPALREYLSGLEKAGRLTQENIDLLAELTGQGATDWHRIEEAVARYGGDISKLGGTFQEQRMHEQWQQVIDDIALFTAGGLSVQDILNLTGKTINDLAIQSQKFGTEIPENMRPWIEQLIASGQLLDENGNKITDISKLHFGETLQTSIEQLNHTIQDLITTLGGVPGAIAAIPKNVDVDVNVNEHHNRDDGNENPAPASTGGRVGRAKVIPFERGGQVPWPSVSGMGRRLLDFTPRGTDTVPALLTPGEWVLNKGHQDVVKRVLGDSLRGMATARATVSALAATGTDGARPTTTNQYYSLERMFEGSILTPDAAPVIADAVTQVFARGGARLTKHQRVLGVKR